MCLGSVCVNNPMPTLTIGTYDPDTGFFRNVEDDAKLAFDAGAQGLADINLIIRLNDLDAFDDETPRFEIRQIVTLEEDELVLHDFTDPDVAFDEVDDTGTRLRDRRLILDASPGRIDGKQAELVVTIAPVDTSDDWETTLKRRVMLVLAP